MLVWKYMFDAITKINKGRGIERGKEIFRLWVIYDYVEVLWLIDYIDVYIYIYIYILYAFDKLSSVCTTHDRLRMLMASMDSLGLRIELGSGLYLFSISFLTHMLYDLF
jgi:hypothetical protein